MATTTDDQHRGQTIREKAMQDRDALRTRASEVERTLMDLRQQERDLTNFLRTLDRYDPKPEHEEKLLDMSQLDSFVYRHQFNKRRRSLVGDLRHGEAIPALRVIGGANRQPSIDTEPPNLNDDDGARIYARCSINPTRSEVTSVSEAALNADVAVRQPENLPSVVKQANFDLPREGSNHRKVTDLAHLYLELMDHYATTAQMVDFMRNEPEIYPLLGARQPQTLSSYLSRDPRFAFERGKGWTLAKDAEGELTDQGGKFPDSGQQEGGVK